MSTATASPASPSPRRRRWHKKFEAMIPAIVKYARFAFRHVRGQDRQDLIQETVANALVAFRRLVRRGRENVAHGSVLAKYAIRQIKDGRRVGSKLNVLEMLSKYAQRHKGFHVERIDHYEPQEQEWAQTVIEDRTAGPADIARTRIDFSTGSIRSNAVTAVSPSSLPRVRLRRRRPRGSRSRRAGFPSCGASWPKAGKSSWVTSLALLWLHSLSSTSRAGVLKAP